MLAFSKDLNRFYKDNTPLWENDSDWEGFGWISADDRDQSVIAFRRTDRKGQTIIVVCNFCPVKRENYRIGIPDEGTIIPVFCSDLTKYGGFTEKLNPVKTEKTPMHSMAQSAELIIPPLSVTYYKLVGKSNSSEA